MIIIDHNGNHTLHCKHITSFEHTQRTAFVSEEGSNFRHFYIVTDRC